LLYTKRTADHQNKMSLLRSRPSPPQPPRDLPTDTYREPQEGAEIQDIPDVSVGDVLNSSIAAGAAGPQGFWEVKGGWKYLRTSAGITNWPDLADTHAPAKIVTLMKDPGFQQRWARPVPFAAIQMGGRTGYRLMWDNNWLQLLHRNTFGSGDKQILRMMSGDTPIAIVLTNKTANALFGEMN